MSNLPIVVLGLDDAEYATLERVSGGKDSVGVYVTALVKQAIALALPRVSDDPAGGLAAAFTTAPRVPPVTAPTAVPKDRGGPPPGARVLMGGRGGRGGPLGNI